MEQEGGDGVRNRRALGAQYAVAGDVHPPHLEHVLELGRVGHVHFQEEEDFRWDVGVLSLLFLLQIIVSLVARLALVGDDVDLPSSSRFLDEPLGLLVYLYLLRAQLGSALHPGDERGKDYREDEEGSDDDAVGPLYLVGHERVDEDDGYGTEREPPTPGALAPGRERDGEGRGGHHRQNAGGVCPGLRVHVGREDDGDDDGD